MAGCGPPHLRKPENIDRARKFCMLGAATNDDPASCFEVARSVRHEWIATISESAEAVRQGRGVAAAAAVERLYFRATDCNEHGKKFLLHRGISSIAR